MDGENNGKPYEQMDDLGGPPLFLETPIFPTKQKYVVRSEAILTSVDAYFWASSSDLSPPVLSLYMVV